MATATFGQVQEFHPENESVTAYLQRVQQFFQANGIQTAKQVPVFLSMIGGKNYSLLWNLVSPDQPKDKSFDQLSEVLKKHFQPKPLVIAERFHFHRRNQASGESLAENVAELRRLAVYCEFMQYLDEALRNRLECGLQSGSIQKRLLSAVELKLPWAVKIAHSMETAERNALQLKGGETEVHQLTRMKDTSKMEPRESNKEKSCYRCGGKGHSPSDCQFREVACHNGGKKGHIAKVCHAKSRGKPSSFQKNNSTDKVGESRSPGELRNRYPRHRTWTVLH